MRNDLKECGKCIRQFRKEMSLSQEIEKLNLIDNGVDLDAIPFSY